MDMTISSQESIRILSKILLFSSKLSDALQLTPQPPHLSIRILNSTQSAYTNFKLSPNFFTTYRYTTRTPQKLPIRALLPIFRAPATINTIHITTPPLTITVNTKTVTKTFSPPLLEGRVPSISSNQPTCEILTTPSFFQNLLQNFHSRLDEITLIPSNESLKLVSFVDDAGPASVMLRTDMTVSARELEHHRCAHDAPVELTLFCRPFRSAIDFCEAFDEPLTIGYDQPGDPVTMEMLIPTDSGETVVDARFVFASRLADDSVVKRRSKLSTQVREESQRPSVRRDTTQRMTEVESSGVVEATPDTAPRSVFETPPRGNYEIPPADEPYGGGRDYRDNDNDDDDDDDDDDFVEGTPPPEE